MNTFTIISLYILLTFTFLYKCLGFKIPHIIIIILFILYLVFLPNINADLDKMDILNILPKNVIPPTTLYNEYINLEKLQYPLIFKTNVCDSCQVLVKRINNYNEANDYINNFPFNKKNIIIQEFIHFQNEVGVFFYRDIYTDKLKIFSMVKAPLHNSIKVSCNNNICEDLTPFVTEKFQNIIDDITSNIKGVYIGRYDIKYKDLYSLLNGEFYILELNLKIPADYIHQIYKFNNNYLKYIYYQIKSFIIIIIIALKQLLCFKINILDSLCILFNRLKSGINCNRIINFT